MGNIPVLLTVDQVADLLQVSRASVYRMVGKKAIPHVRVGRSIRFDRADLARWLREMSEPARAKSGSRAGARRQRRVDALLREGHEARVNEHEALKQMLTGRRKLPWRSAGGRVDKLVDLDAAFPRGRNRPK